jgi:hypothetical protein
MAYFSPQIALLSLKISGFRGLCPIILATCLRPTLSDLITLFEIKEAHLYQPYAVCREARSIFLALCCRFLNNSTSLVQIAQALGNVSVAAVSQNRKRLEARMKQYERLVQSFERLKADLEEELLTVKV